MGIVMSLVAGKGVPSTQVLSLVMTTLDKQFIDEKIKINNVHDFHMAILDIFSTINSALPGKHYDVPSRKDVEECFVEWKVAKDRDTERKVFVQFMKERINLSKLDDSTLITGLITPPVAMAAKRAGENVPQLRMIKAIPDVVFVPSATVLSLISVQLFRKIFRGNTASDNTTPTADASPPPSDPAPIVPKPADASPPEKIM